MPDARAANSEVVDERDLVERARARDQEAFRILVDRHRDRAYALALRFLKSPDDAEEVAQDAFVRAWLALPGFRFEARFATWLYRIVARRAIDRLSVLRKRRERETPIEATIEPAVPEASRMDADARRLEELVAALPDAQRMVVAMFYYEDQSVERVAAAMGMPVGTVKTHLSRARQALREAWTKR